MGARRSTKTAPCPVENSLSTRLSDGAYTSVVAKKEKDNKGEEGAVFKLALKGGQPKLSESTKDSSPEEIESA